MLRSCAVAFCLLAAVSAGALPQKSRAGWSGLPPNKAPTPNYTDIMQKMWDLDVNGATDVTMQLAIQGNTSITSQVDEAPEKLFTFVDETVLLSKPTIAAFVALRDNYNHLIGVKEEETASERAEVERFLELIGRTEVMKAALEYLQKAGQPFATMKDLTNYMKSIWFTLYPRSKNWNNTVDSSGFEHVFLGESKKTKVIGGMHNWIQAYLLEKSGNLDYTGYINSYTSVAPGRFVFGARLRAYNNYWKNPFSSFIFGSSPEFDFAAYTICFALRVHKQCSFEIDGKLIHIRTSRFMPNYNYIDTAYPEVPF